MALTSASIFQTTATATTGNVNGSGYNINNANFLTNLAATSANTASPVVTSASYNFVAGDVNNWVYVKSGTNWTAGWYQIASVAANAATLNAAIGAAVLTINAIGTVTYNTVAGCATVASPTGGTFGVDYSQTDTANSSVTDASSVGSSTTLTSVTAPWTPVSVGNFYHQTTTGTGAFGVVGWYEIVSYNSAGSVVLDRTPNSGTASVNCTGQTGGAGRLNALEDTYMNMLPSSSIVWLKTGTTSPTGSISTAGTNSTAILPSYFIGFTSIRGDACNGTNRPLLSCGASTVTPPQFIIFTNISITGTGVSLLSLRSGNSLNNCKITNPSTSAGRSAITTNSAGVANTIANCEVVCQNGIGITPSSITPIITGSYIHDSATGISGATISAIGNIFESNATAAMTLTSSNNNIYNNTIYGTEAIVGIGLNFSTANSSNNKVFNNILYGLTTGITVATGRADSNADMFNDFFNNTTDATNWLKGPTDIAVNPAFAGASQITGSTATTSGSVLTAGSIFSGVNDNVDYLHVVSGTGVTVGCYLITSHTATTITVNNALGTSVAGNVVFWVTNGHNFQVGPALANVGFPNFTNTTNSLTTSYPGIGAVIRSNLAPTLASTFVG